MPKLSVAIIGSTTSDGSEVVLSQQKSDAYSPEILENLINDLIGKASGRALVDYKDIQVTVSLTTEDSEVVRPSLSLSSETIKKLSNMGASFDFDPYV